MLLHTYAGLLILGTVAGIVISRIRAHSLIRTTFEAIGGLTHASFVIAWAHPAVANALGTAIWLMLILVLVWSVFSVEVAMREIQADEWWRDLSDTGAATCETIVLGILFLIMFPAIAMGLLLSLRQLS